jgi:hypothetical protein
MTTRRDVIAAAALLAPLSLTLKMAQAAEESHKAEEGRYESGEHNAKEGKIADFLFVQNARGIVYSEGKLTLMDVSPVTVMFSDRPERIAGHMATSRFVPFWKDGKDSFLKDPPNATLSFTEDKQLNDVVVELKDPVLEGDDLIYEVRVLEGKMPAEGGLASLFIDIIGMPLTPLSYAGVARRTWRRAVLY